VRVHVVRFQLMAKSKIKTEQYQESAWTEVEFNVYLIFIKFNYPYGGGSGGICL